jgi:hydroxyacyl-ACP dehydratase HTD2-like protein with hotdog domain
MPTTYQAGDLLPRLHHTVTAFQLFRYSAVTWNPHRIHFDESYAHQEGHGGLALHSHLRAALALRCVTEGLALGGRSRTCPTGCASRSRRRPT